MKITRKEFLGQLVAGVSGIAGAAMLIGCGSSDSPGPDAQTGNCTANGTAVTIGTNHGHTLTVSKADVTAGVDKTYDITGTATHAHSVKITAAMFTMLKGNTSAMTVSLADGTGHTHTITVACA
jgi:hypothetical protein